MAKFDPSNPSLYETNYVGGYGPSDAKLVVIGEAPGSDEDDEGKPFVGRVGKLTREMLGIGRMHDSKVYFTNIERCQPPNNKLSLLKAIGRKAGQDIEDLYNEVDALDANCHLLLGEHALKWFGKKKKIKHWRGTIFTVNVRGKDRKCVSTYHPSALLRSESEETKTFSYSARAYMQLDFNRAISQSKFPDLRLPKRTLQYARSADQFREFLSRYLPTHKEVSIDIETTKGSCIPTCIGFAFTPYHGMSVPLINVGGGVFTSEEDKVQLWRLVQSVLGDPTINLIGQNIKFDLRKLVRTYGFVLRANVYFDCGMCQHVLYPEFPKSLEFQTSTWTEEPFYKDELREYDPDKESFETILIYNAKDVCVPFEIYTKMMKELEERNLTDFFFNEIMPLSNLYMDMEDRGMELNVEVRKRIIAKYQVLSRELDNQLESMIGYHLDLGSHIKVKRLLFDELKLPRRVNVKEDTLVALIGNHAKGDPVKYGVLDAILDKRKVDRLLNGPLASEPDYDGKMRTVFNINGAANGRTSANLLKPPERPGIIVITDSDKREYSSSTGMQAHNLSKHGEFGPDMRSMLEPSKGKIFVQADKSQAEARVVAALAKDDWLLSLFERGKDVHSITASWFFNKDNSDDPENPIGIDYNTERFVGKTGRHAMAYDARGRKIMLTINKLARKFDINLTISEQEAKLFRYTFHKKSPKIQSVFYKEVVEAYRSGGKKKLTAASGRVRQFFGIFDPNLLYSWIPSTSVSDDTKFGAVRVQNRIKQLEILLEGHDSILFQCYPSEVEEFCAIVKEEFEKPMSLERCSLPRDPIIIPCDFEIGENYKDLQKMKLLDK